METKENNWKQILNNKETLLFFVVAGFVFVVDQISKYFIELAHQDLQWWFFRIVYSTNTGAGFGILQNNSFILGIVSLIAAVLVVWYYPKLPRSRLYALLMGLFLGGIIGNGVDRLVKEYVVDFIATSFWPSFNVADAAITVAAVGYILLMLYEEFSGKNKLK